LHALSYVPAATADPRSDERIPVYPDFAVRLAALCVAGLVVLITLATFVPRPLGDPADPTGPFTQAIRPRWYVLPAHEIFRLAPPRLLGMESPVFIGAAGTALFLVVLGLPALDRVGSRITVAVACVLLFLATLLMLHGLV
jgi:quinol-cytochrome oxidoreductase complex cytochrome b subunit